MNISCRNPIRDELLLGKLDPVTANLFDELRPLFAGRDQFEWILDLVEVEAGVRARLLSRGGLDEGSAIAERWVRGTAEASRNKAVAVWRRTQRAAREALCQRLPDQPQVIVCNHETGELIVAYFWRGWRLSEIRSFWITECQARGWAKADIAVREG